MAQALTRRQQQVYEFLVRHRFARPPTLDELCAAMGLSSRGSLHKHIAALIDAGLVEPLNHLQRGVRPSQPAEAPSPGVLYLGRIAAGRPIEAVANPEPVDVPPQLLGRGACYVLEVRGDSMIEEGILDGDRVVVEARSDARDGELVVALVDGADATLKRLERRAGRIVLHPANAALAPLEYEAERVAIQGVVTGLMRSYR